MTVPEARVICDSESPDGKRLLTYEVKAHRFILAEINTHRVLSRNYRSSRAVPTHKLIQEVLTAPTMPVFWGKNQPGMQAAVELEDGGRGSERQRAMRYWEAAAHHAAEIAGCMDRIGVHKQIVNRLLEPFLWVHGVISATEWENFFGLRLHKDAQPEFRVLSDAMFSAGSNSTPTLLKPGEWHLPYVRGYLDDRDLLPPGNRQGLTPHEQMLRISAARCARVSYKSFDTDKPSAVEEDLKLFDKLMGAQPFHASPTEHQATPDSMAEIDFMPFWENRKEHGNFTGWRQFRKMIPGEAVAPLPAAYT